MSSSSLDSETGKGFQRILRPLVIEQHSLFVNVEFDGKKLSITGVHGPKSNGDCGQCVDLLQAKDAKLVEPWTKELVHDLWSIWDRWHLNDMRAGCRHQRDLKWNEKPIDPSKPTNTYGIHYEGQFNPSWNMLVWVRRKEHPEGLLSEPCPVCGYKYGTKWLHEDVPDDVLAKLRGMPVTDRKPAWV